MHFYKDVLATNYTQLQKKLPKNYKFLLKSLTFSITWSAKHLQELNDCQFMTETRARIIWKHATGSCLQENALNSRLNSGLLLVCLLKGNPQNVSKACKKVIVLILVPSRALMSVYLVSLSLSPNLSSSLVLVTSWSKT